MIDCKSWSETYATALLPCNLNPNAVGFTLHLIASDSDTLIAIGLPCPSFACDDSTDGVDYVFEAHRQIVKDVEEIGCESRQHDLARQLNFIAMRLEPYGDSALLIFMPAILHAPRLKAIRLTLGSDRQVNEDFSL